MAELALSLPTGQETRSCSRVVAQTYFLKETQNAPSNGIRLKPVFWEELLGVCV